MSGYDHKPTVIDLRKTNQTCVACAECQRLFTIDNVVVLSKTKCSEEIYLCHDCFDYKNLEAKEKQWK